MGIKSHSNALIYNNTHNILFCLRRGGSRAAATSKMEHFVIIVNGCKPLTIITKRSILDVAAVLDPPVTYINEKKYLPDNTEFWNSIKY